MRMRVGDNRSKEMIARTWSGRKRSEDAEAYLEVVRRTGLSEIAETRQNVLMMLNTNSLI